MIVIREVKSRKEKKDFLNFPLKMYKNCEYFVPPLYADEKKIFNKKFYYNLTSKSIFFNAYENGKIVGRIQGILHFASNSKWNQKRVRFTRFDSIDSNEVASALLNAVEKWAKENNMDEVVGPLGYSDMEREGLLIEGFNELSTFEEQYNYEYYKNLIEACGYEKEVDWVERQIFAPKEIDPRIEKIVGNIMTKEGFRLVEFKNTKELLDKYSNQFFDLVDETYNDLYGTVPFIEEQKKEIIKAFKFIISPNYIRLVTNKENEIVAFGLCFPSIGKALQKSGGHLTIPALFKVFKAIKKPEILDLGLIGVAKKYKNSGAPWVIFLEMMRMLKASDTIKYCETNLNLEDNKAIQNNWDRFENRLHKRRRCFVKKLI